MQRLECLVADVKTDLQNQIAAAVARKKDLMLPSYEKDGHDEFEKRMAPSMLKQLGAICKQIDAAVEEAAALCRHLNAQPAHFVRGYDDGVRARREGLLIMCTVTAVKANPQQKEA